MDILCTNDDGYLAVGIRVLAGAAAEAGSVHVVAPDREQSATSHSLTLHHPLRVRESAEGWSIVDGTPTDCVLMALGELLPSPVDLCVSGVNHGPNMGEDVLYSGTVAAAMEATVMGIPALAVSYAGDDPTRIAAWAPALSQLIDRIPTNGSFPADTLLNINLPPIQPADAKGIRVTSLGQRRYSDSVTRAKDPMGREYFWIGGGASEWRGDDASDFRAIEEGYISVTPLHLDLTNYGLLEEIRGWNLTL